jgi:hypothetical protein
MMTTHIRRLSTRKLERLAAEADLIDAWLRLDDLDAHEARRLARRARAIQRRAHRATADTFHRRYYIGVILRVAARAAAAFERLEPLAA